VPYWILHSRHYCHQNCLEKLYIKIWIYTAITSSVWKNVIQRSEYSNSNTITIYLKARQFWLKKTITRMCPIESYTADTTVTRTVWKNFI
jgi:hypothetical protein